MKMLVLYFSAILLSGACICQAETEGLVRKIITVGDEFPSMSIGFLNNQTEYEVHLNSTKHPCTNVYVCEIFVTLTEMVCKNISKGPDQPYLEIRGVVSSARNLTIKWCREYGIAEDFAQDEFLKLKSAVLTPRGDWSKTNATVLLMASFYEQTILQTETLSVSDNPVEVRVEAEGKQFELYLNTSSKICLENQNDCSIGAHIEMTCPQKSKTSSAELQLDVISVTNETVSKILCPLKCTDANGVIKNISTYLVNARSIIITPSGSWKAGKASAFITLHTIPGEKTNRCPEKSFDCNKKCTTSRPPLFGMRNANGGNNRYLLDGTQDSALRCVPYSWLCGNYGGNCDMCEAAKQFCLIRPDQSQEPQTDETNINVYIGNDRSCMYYYALFLIPSGLILIMLVTMAYFMRQRLSARVESANDTRRTKQAMQLLGKIPKNIPYQMVENETS